MLSRALPLLFAAAAVQAATPADTRFIDVFSPLRTEMAALSPDGKRLAYSVREGDTISIVVLEVDAPKQATALVAVAQDKYTTGYLDSVYNDHASRLLWMCWVSPDRLVVESNLQFLTGHRTPPGAIFGFDYNGAHAALLYSGKQAWAFVRPVGVVSGRQPELLMREADRWIALDAMTAKVRPLKDEEARKLERDLRARDQAEASRQRASRADLQALFPHREVTFYAHGGTSDRVLALVQNVADAGAYLVYDPTSHQAWEFAARAPWLGDSRIHPAEFFDLTDARGEHFTGMLVLPRSPRIKRAPLVLWVPENLGSRVRGFYHPEVQALADMGFAVAVVDSLQFLPPDSPAPDLPGADRPPLPRVKSDLAAEVTHQMHSLDVLADHYPVSRSAVALFGQSATANRALVAASTHPGRLRCLVALNPSLDGGNDHRAGRFTALDAALAKAGPPPVESTLLLSFPGPSGKAFGKNQDYLAARSARSLLEKRGVVTGWSQLDEFYMAHQAAARAAAFREIEAFLTEHLYRYSVKLGELEVLEEKPPELPR